MRELVYPLSAVPPNPPHVRSMPEGFYYDHHITGVTARVVEGNLRVPLPGPRFAALELAGAFALGPDFLDAWARANAEALAECPDAPRLEPGRGVAWWRYVTSRHALRLAWPSADVTILDLLLFARRDTGEVARVIVWPESASSVILPEAADLVVVRPDALRLGAPRPAGLMRRDTALTHLGDRARRIDEPVPHWLVRNGDAHPFVVRGLRSLVDVPASSYGAVRPSEVVDETLRSE